MIDSGDLDKLGKIQRIDVQRSGVSEVPVPADLFDCWAKISSTGGREFRAARANNPQLNAEITIRYRRDKVLQPADIFVCGSREFDIQGVINEDERDEAWLLHCIERLPQFR